jgi:hypothetical protein
MDVLEKNILLLYKTRVKSTIVFENRTRYHIWIDALQFTTDSDTTIL